MARVSRPRLGELLVRAGVITPEQVDAAAAVHRANQRTIGQQLLADGAVSELDLAAALSYQLDIPFVPLASYPIDEVAALLTPSDLARRHRMLVIGSRYDEILVAMADPTDVAGRTALAERIGRRIIPVLALASEIDRERGRRDLPTVPEPEEEPARRPEPAAPPAPPRAEPAPERAERVGQRASGELVPFPRPGQRPAEEPSAQPRPTAPPPGPREVERVGEPAPQPEPEPAREPEPAAVRPAARAEPPPSQPGGPPARAEPRARAEAGAEAQIVRFFLSQAIREGASDVHVEPLADRLRVRIRVEGVLRELTQLPREMAGPIAAHIRALAHVGRDDQQGRLVISDAGHDAAFGFTAVATLYGEKVVLRVIERIDVAPDLDDLGMEAGTLERWRELLRSPYGLLLAAGAPGTGKTTTLHASLRELPLLTKDVTTVEDPVITAIDGVNQVQVDRASGATLASTLRRVLAQEPDVVMVSELRDRDTAEAAMNAALAGRLILSTVQAGDALGALYRLLALGADPYLVSASSVAVLAQLLVPRLCESCKVPAQPDMVVAAQLRAAGVEWSRVYSARGCARCNGTGHRGRVAAFELLMPNAELRAAIERGAKIEEAREIATRSGLVSLREAGLRLVAEGHASMADVTSRLPATG